MQVCLKLILRLVPVQNDTWTRFFVAVFVIPKNWKQLMLFFRGLVKLWCISQRLLCQGKGKNEAFYVPIQKEIQDKLLTE